MQLKSPLGVAPAFLAALWMIVAVQSVQAQAGNDRSLAAVERVRVDAAPLAEDRYLMQAMRIGRDLVVYRLDTITGQTWTVNGTALDRIKESGAIPEGNFDIEVVPVKGDREHWVVRVDRKTGRMWYATEGRWQAYSEKP